MQQENGWLSADYNYGIYNKGEGTAYWLASPYDNQYSNQLLVSGWYAGTMFDFLISEYSARPIVGIPTTVFESKYADSLVDN